MMDKVKIDRDSKTPQEFRALKNFNAHFLRRTKYFDFVPYTGELKYEVISGSGFAITGLQACNGKNIRETFRTILVLNCVGCNNRQLVKIETTRKRNVGT